MINFSLLFQTERKITTEVLTDDYRAAILVRQHAPLCNKVLFLRSLVISAQKLTVLIVTHFSAL